MQLARVCCPPSCGRTADTPSILVVLRAWWLNTQTRHVPHAASLGNPVRILCSKRNANTKASPYQHGYLASTQDQLRHLASCAASLAQQWGQHTPADTITRQPTPSTRPTTPARPTTTPRPTPPPGPPTTSRPPTASRPTTTGILATGGPPPPHPDRDSSSNSNSSSSSTSASSTPSPSACPSPRASDHAPTPTQQTPHANDSGTTHQPLQGRRLQEALASLDRLHASDFLEQRCSTFRTPPPFLPGPLRRALHFTLALIDSAPHNNRLDHERAWKLWLFLPRMLLHRPANTARVPKPHLLERFAKSFEGTWQDLLLAASAAPSQSAQRSPPPASNQPTHPAHPPRRTFPGSTSTPRQ